MEFTLNAEFDVSPKQLFQAWLSSKAHTEMTGGKAKINNKQGASFSAWDGYIKGKNLIIEPFSRIIQSWRTSDFDESEEDSQVELLLLEKDSGTRLTLIHKNLGVDGEKYKSGWIDNYFKPMQDYFDA
ncbi:MAG: SRPBCC domain-containing protein [Bacteroidia bacterium]